MFVVLIILYDMFVVLIVLYEEYIVVFVFYWHLGDQSRLF